MAFGRACPGKGGSGRFCLPHLPSIRPITIRGIIVVTVLLVLGTSAFVMKTAALIFATVTRFPGLRSPADAIEFCFAMLAVLVVMALLFRKVGLRYTPRGLAFFCLAIVGMGFMGSTGVFATAPSSAARITVDGYCYDYQNVYVGRTIEYVFRLALDTGSVLHLQTPLTPSWIQDGTRLRVTYLDEPRAAPDLPRAIALTVLSGDHIGWHGSVDANWLGAWLAFPIGLLICLAGLVGALKNRRLDVVPDGSDGNDEQKLGLTDLHLL
jgi:hypothetical protein